MGPYQESPTAIESDRERTHDYVKKRVKVDQINRTANNQSNKDISNLSPTEEVCLTGEDKIYCYAVLGDKNERTIYSDLTNWFPVEFYDKKNYILLRTRTNSILFL